MKKIKLIGLLLLYTTTACIGQTIIKNPNAEKRIVADFSGIVVFHPILIYLSKGNENAVAVSARNSEDAANVITKVEKGILKIYFENPEQTWPKGNMNGDRKLVVYVTAKDIDSINASFGAAVRIEQEIKPKILRIDCSSGAVIQGKINVDSLMLNISGWGISKLTGAANYINVVTKENVSVEAKELIGREIVAKCLNNSKLSVCAMKSLAIIARDKSVVVYRGSGKIVTTKSRHAIIKKVE